MELDILVITHNHLELSINCVKAIVQNTASPFTLTILDDSTDLTPDYFTAFCKEHPNVRYHRVEPPGCANKLWNIGLRETSNLYVATIVNSVIVEPEWDLPAVELLENNPRAGMVGFKLLYLHGTIWHAGCKLGDGIFNHIGVGQPGHRFAKNYRCPAVTGAMVLARRLALDKGWDETTYHGFTGWDDIDLCMQMRTDGWEVWYTGLGCGYHIEAPTRLQGKTPEEQAEFWKKYEENKQRFLTKWGKML